MEDTRPPIPPYSSFFVFSQSNKFRVWVHHTVFTTAMDNFILVLIIISSLLLAVEDPVNKEADINENLKFADYFFTAMFCIEMTMKLIALGVVLHPGSYVRDPWNILDATVVLASLVDFALTVE